MPVIPLLPALELAIAEEMRRDERVYFMSFRRQQKLTAEFGEARVRLTPISETALTGIAIGSAAVGLKPILYVGNVTFSFVAFDQIVNQAAKMHYMFGAQRDLPLVIRVQYGGGLGLAAQHSQSPYSMFAHVPGLKVIVPSGAADAKSLLKTAIRDNNPVIFFEAARLETLAEEVPEGEHLLPFGQAAIKREGTDVTVVTLGFMTQLVLEAAAQLAKRGMSVEVVDLRSLVPMDVATVRSSVRRTGRLVIVDEAPAMCSVASEIAAMIAEDRESLSALRAPIVRVNGAAVPVPYSEPMESYVLPNVVRIVDAIAQVVEERRVIART
jgi:pyruvate dehydrogenase E1 component beta subunit